MLESVLLARAAGRLRDDTATAAVRFNRPPIRFIVP
jgi:hypothetical protein